MLLYQVCSCKPSRAKLRWRLLRLLVVQLGLFTLLRRPLFRIHTASAASAALLALSSISLLVMKPLLAFLYLLWGICGVIEKNCSRPPSVPMPYRFVRFHWKMYNKKGRCCSSDNQSKVEMQRIIKPMQLQKSEFPPSTPRHSLAKKSSYYCTKIRTFCVLNIARRQPSPWSSLIGGRSIPETGDRRTALPAPGLWRQALTFSGHLRNDWTLPWENNWQWCPRWLFSHDCDNMWIGSSRLIWSLPPPSMSASKFNTIAFRYCKIT